MSLESSNVAVDLSAVGRAIDERLATDRVEEAAALARTVLIRLPRHLATYQRLVRATWQLKRWQEGEDWSRRLLQADPGNAVAWRSLAFAVEYKGMRNAARAMWKRAFESDPYGPDIRSGLSRTSLDRPDPLGLNTACLASLYLRCGRWAHASVAYKSLVQAEDRRIDFQVNWMAALWQQNARQDAYRLARHLTRRQPHLILAWSVLAALGDVDDRALARHPLASMDPDGEFVRNWLGVPYGTGKVTIAVSEAEAALLAH